MIRESGPSVVEGIQAISTFILVLITGWYAVLTHSIAKSAEQSRRDAETREQRATAKAVDDEAASRINAVKGMLYELTTLDNYIEGITSDGATMAPFPQLQLVTLGQFMQSVTELPPACVESVLRVHYQLVASNARADTPGYLKRVPGLHDCIGSAVTSLQSYLASWTGAT